MTCCLCGKLYDPVERNKQYFNVTDMDEMKVIPIHCLHVDGKTLALCHTCMKAAGFGKLIFSKNKRYIFNEKLHSKMYEVDQEWADWNMPKNDTHATGFKKHKKKVS